MMTTSIAPVLQNLDQALQRLETAIETRLDVKIEHQVEMDLGYDDQLDTMISKKLDNTISQLETFLRED